MTTIRRSVVLGAAIILATISSVSAADLYDGGYKGSLKDAPVLEGPAAWYIRGDAAWATHDDPTMVEQGEFDLNNTSIDSTWALGLGVGRYFTSSLRGDITYDYRFESDVSGTQNDPLAPFPGQRRFGLQSHVFLANMYYDFNRQGRFNPYLGVGLGFTINTTKNATLQDDCGCTATLQGARQTDVAAALMAGFSLKLRNKFYLDAGYRFLYLGEAHTGEITGTIGGTPQVIGDPTVEQIIAHEFRVGFRYDIR